jgi:hypothetical protein
MRFNKPQAFALRKTTVGLAFIQQHTQGRAYAKNEAAVASHATINSVPPFGAMKLGPESGLSTV